MSADRWLRVEEIYHAALERAPAVRAAFLVEACCGDDGLRREVESLLDHDAKADAFLARPALEAEAAGLSRKAALLGEADIEGYAILSLLGAGGMGEIYRARDLTLGREVAIKVVAGSVAFGSGGLRRFEEEARLASALNHPNIVTIYGVGQKDDLAYIAMELVRGRTLRDVLADGPLPVRDALDVAVQTADALAAAHASGIIHRDLKPENLMVTPEGLVKVLDFGIAKLQGAGDAAPAQEQRPRRETVTEAGVILGTIGYMSPEQAAGKPAEPASDQFSFGAILYELLSGRRAFKRRTQAATLDAILHEQPEPIEGLDAGVSAPLGAVLARCLAKDPADRYPDTRELAQRLRAIRDEWERPAAASTRRRMVWLAATAAVAAAIGLATWRLRPREAGPRSLAVLPFANVLNDANTEYLSDGMTQGLIRRISGLSSLIVKPLSAVLNFKGTGVDPRDAGRQLSADAVLAGTVMLKSGRVLVTAELVEVATGARLWTNTYDRVATDELSIQDEIAQAIIQEGIPVPVSDAERRRLERRPTADPEAYDLYLQAIPIIEQGTEDGYLEARGLLHKALAMDPNFALAYVALATTYSVMAVEGYERPADNLVQVTRLVRRALDSDPDLPDAHSEAAVALFYFQRDWAASEQEWSRALQSRGGGIVPDFLLAYALQQWALGKTDAALALARRARDLDPLSPRIIVSEGDFLLHAGALDQAATLYETAIRAERGAASAGHRVAVSNAWLGLAEVRRRQERFEEAIEARRRGAEAAGDGALRDLFAKARGAEGYRQIDEATARGQLEALQARAAEGGYVSPLDFARAYAQLGDRPRALAYLDGALADQSPGLVFLQVDPAWNSVRDDPRFLAALKEVGLPTPS